MANIETTRETSATNSWTYTVPAGVTAQLKWLYLEYTSSATVGNRQILLEVTNAAGVKYTDFHAGAVQAAGVENDYNFMQGIYRETAFVAGSIQVPIAQDLVVHEGWKIKVYDLNNVSAGDAMSIGLQYERLV